MACLNSYHYLVKKTSCDLKNAILFGIDLRCRARNNCIADDSHLKYEKSILKGMDLVDTTAVTHVNYY